MTVPTKAHETDACFDLYADEPNATYMSPYDLNQHEGVCIGAHKTVKIHTGFATNIPHGYWGAVFARSGVATKQYLRPAQGVPVIDEPYTGEWLIPLHNDSDEDKIIHHGDRIAQFTLLPYFDTKLTEVNELESTDRSDSGFGSSGV
jgi:dUTP pyrophosphatase